MEQSLSVKFGIDISEFEQGMDKIKKTLDKASSDIEGSMDDVGKTVEKSTGGMSKAIKGVGVALATAFAFDKIKDFAVFGIQASSELEAMNAQFEQIFKESQVIAQKAVDGMANDLGMLPNRIKPSFTKMSSMWMGMGLDTEEAMEKSEKAVTMSADLAAFWDKSYEEANASFQSWLKGNTDAGDSIGFTASQAEIGAWANEKYGVSFDKLSEKEKQLIRLDYAEELLKNQQVTGQASRESESFTNVLGNLQQAWTDFSAVLMKPVLPIVIDGMQVLISALQSATTWIQSFYDSFDSGSLSNVAEMFNQIKESILGGNFSDISELIPRMVESILSNDVSLLGVGANIINKIADGMGMSVSELMTMVVQVASSIVEGFVKSLPTIIGTGVQMIEGLINGIISALPIVLGTIGTLITTIISSITTILPQILNLGLQLLSSLVEGIIVALPLLIEGVTQLITSFITMLVENLPMILEMGMTLLQTLIDGILNNLVILVEALTMVLTTLVQYITDNLPMILEAGISLLLTLVQGILDQLPTMVNTILDLVLLIVDVVLENLPMIIEAGIDILLALIDGIIDMLPDLIACAIELIFAINQAIIDNLPEIIEAGIEILLALIDGLIKMIPELKSAQGDIIDKIFEGFAKVDWLSIGKDIILGIVKGITKNVSTVLGTVKEVAKDLLNAGKAVLQIGSPSKVFEEEIGKAIPTGVAVGIRKEENVATSAVNDMSKSLADTGISNRVNQLPRVGGYGFNRSEEGNLTYNFNSVLEVDGREIARATAIFIQEELAKIQKKQNRLSGQYA